MQHRDKIINPVYLPTRNQIANILTKSLGARNQGIVLVVWFRLLSNTLISLVDSPRRKPILQCRMLLPKKSHVRANEKVR